MKTKVLLISCVLLTSLIIAAIFVDNNDKKVISSEHGNKSIMNTNSLTMMYETDYNSGEYTVSSDTSWLGDEYIFNQILSKCENGGTLSWDDGTKKVTMKTSSSDKCFVYFDKYIMPEITNVEAIDITSNSITVSITASGGDSSIVSYHYCINNEEYISSNSSVYTFENLNAETSYNIKVYVTDGNRRTSNIENNTVRTENNLITFTIILTDYRGGSESYTYYAEKDMTWKEFVNSKYNDGKFSMCADDDSYFPDSVAFNSMLSGLSKNDVIIADNVYTMSTPAVSISCDNVSEIL